MKTIHISLSCLIISLLLGLTSCFRGEESIIRVPIQEISKVPHKTQNLIVVTLDGFRWQEVFNGADSVLLFNYNYTSVDSGWLRNKFWDTDYTVRRKKLMPFFWNTLVNRGKIFGNRKLGNFVDVRNPFRISYPGFSEIFTGYVDYNINSNLFGENPNYNVLEFINGQSGFRNNNVSAFCVWDEFSDILNSKRNGLNVICGAKDGMPASGYYLRDSMAISINKQLPSLGLYPVIGSPSNYDREIYALAKSDLVRTHPRVLYIAFLGTDTYGHLGRYDSYLIDAYNINLMLNDLWNFIDSSAVYKDKTTLFITCDHGRGNGAEWISHGADVSHSEDTWFAIIGPDTKPLGEIGTSQQFYQMQFARTFSSLLGWEVSGVKEMGTSIQAVMDNN